MEEHFLPVDAGLFETKSIVGDTFDVVPKGFLPRQLKKCVYRKDHVTAIIRKLQVLVKEENRNVPGLYLQGPAGVGKSVIVYTITQIAKFHLGWLTVYLPDCRAWRQISNIQAMAFFLDRLMEAFFTTDLQEKFGEIYNLLKDSRTQQSSSYWEEQVSVVRDKERDLKVAEAYQKVILLLRVNTSDTPLLLVFDEVNALFEKNERIHDGSPWSITDFGSPKLKQGALLVSGTSDCEFLGTIPAGYDRTDDCVYQLTEFEPEETEHLLNTELGGPLKRIREFEPKLWHELADACGNMPRDLRGFAARLDDLSSRIVDDIEEPAKKKLKLEIGSAIQEKKRENQLYHRRLFENIIKKDHERGSNVFEKNLLEWCEKYFLENELRGSLEILRAPNFIVQGTQMRPTSVDASQAYFDWFVRKSKEREPDSILNNLAIVCDENSDPNGSERGHAFERFLSSKLTLCGIQRDFRLRYHLLLEKQIKSLALHIRNRVFAKADCPPKDFRNFAEGTLLTHTDRGGGQARVDLIHYGPNEVIYMEATVGNYRTTKVPSGKEEKDRTVLILRAMRKWLGEDVYNVEINSDSSGLTVTYKESYTSRSTADRKPVPKVHYVVVTTCPSTVQPTLERARMYQWIKVCFLDDLIASGIIPREKSTSILGAQTADARSGGLLELLTLKFSS